MRILLADAIPDRHIDELRARGDDCTIEPGLSAADLPERIGNAEVLVVRSTKVTAEALDAAEQLGLVVRAGAGPTRSTARQPLAAASTCATCPGPTPSPWPS